MGCVKRYRYGAMMDGLQFQLGRLVIGFGRSAMMPFASSRQLKIGCWVDEVSIFWLFLWHWHLVISIWEEPRVKEKKR